MESNILLQALDKSECFPNRTFAHWVVAGNLGGPMSKVRNNLN